MIRLLRFLVSRKTRSRTGRASLESGGESGEPGQRRKGTLKEFTDRVREHFREMTCLRDDQDFLMAIFDSAIQSATMEKVKDLLEEYAKEED